MADLAVALLSLTVPVVRRPVVVPLFVDVLALRPLLEEAIAEASLPFTLLATSPEPVVVLLPYR